LPARGVTVWQLVLPDDRALLEEAATTVLSILDG
jgi:hypothetical protein